MNKQAPFAPASRIISYHADEDLSSVLDDASKDVLRNAFSSSHINFLLGAGFSAGLVQTLGNRERWLEWCNKHEWGSPDLANSAEALFQLEYFKNILIPMKVIRPTPEMIRFFDHVRRIIATRGTTAIPRRACIFTTNYDPMVELAFEQLGCTYNDGFEGRANPVFTTRSFSRTQYQQSLSMEYSAQVPTLNVIKLHGSVTWCKDLSSGTIGYHNHSEALASFEKENENLLTFGELVETERFVQLTIEEAGDDAAQLVEETSSEHARALKQFLEEYRRSFYLINPTKRKFEETVFGLTYYELLRLYANELDRNNTLLISFGFSFDDEHILEITKRALENPQLILLVCCHKEADLEKYQAKFPNAVNVWYVVPSGGDFTLRGLVAMLGEMR